MISKVWSISQPTFMFANFFVHSPALAVGLFSLNNKFRLDLPIFSVSHIAKNKDVQRVNFLKTSVMLALSWK